MGRREPRFHGPVLTWREDIECVNDTPCLVFLFIIYVSLLEDNFWCYSPFMTANGSSCTACRKYLVVTYPPRIQCFQSRVSSTQYMQPFYIKTSPLPCA